MAKPPTTDDRKLTTAMLAFQRSLEASEATMTGLDASGERRRPVEVRRKGVRGQIGQANLKANKAGTSNLQGIDHATLPEGCDRLEIAFSLTILPNGRRPSAAGDPIVRENFVRFTDAYRQQGGFDVLAERYVGAIATGRFAWRNRGLSAPLGAEVQVAWRGESIAFDPFKLGLDRVPTRPELEAAVTQGTPAPLIDAVAASLGGDPISLEVRWIGRLPINAEVYPSQEYVREAEKGDDASRVLSSITRMIGGERVRCATIHSQKIGAALRCVDDWHGDDLYGPVPVNPYGGVQEAGIALRYGNPAAPSYFDLAKKPGPMWDALDRGEATPDLHFFVANLVRGGVFGEKGDG